MSAFNGEKNQKSERTGIGRGGGGGLKEGSFSYKFQGVKEKARSEFINLRMILFYFEVSIVQSNIKVSI